jgi:rubredoxin
MAGDRTRRQSGSGSVPHHGKWVFDVITWKWYEVRESYRMQRNADVWLQPPGGYDPRHVGRKQFVAEIGSRLLLRRVTNALRDRGAFAEEAGSMAVSVYTDQLGLSPDDLTCPDCGADADDGQVRCHNPQDAEDGGTLLLHCRHCRYNWDADPGADA